MDFTFVVCFYVIYKCDISLIFIYLFSKNSKLVLFLYIYRPSTISTSKYIKNICISKFINLKHLTLNVTKMHRIYYLLNENM